MRILAALIACLQMVLLAHPAAAQAAPSIRTVTTVSWVEEWDPRRGEWVRVADDSGEDLPTITYVNGVEVARTQPASRYAPPARAAVTAEPIARYGPFVVTSATHAALIGTTDAASPAWFDAMLRDHPALAVLDMVEAPGTSHDIANLAVGRRIRAAGLETHVPAHGSVRSGAVELFLAGARRTIDEGAEFAVHSWLDTQGHEADDFAAGHDAHRLYIDYYREMGMSAARARAFYAMTNSVPHSAALWLDASEMRAWVEPRSVVAAAPAAQHAKIVLLDYDPDLIALASLELSPKLSPKLLLDSHATFP